MAEPFLGQIQIFGFTFAPRGWAFCNGQILPIAQNTALFSLLGTTYGGNGQTTFALPNLQSRFPIHFGQGPGLSPYDLGQQGGVETVTLISTQMPAHQHTVSILVNGAAGSSAKSVGRYLSNAGTDQIYDPNNTNEFMGPQPPTGISGGSQPHENIPPYLALNFCIALQGIFPSRN